MIAGLRISAVRIALIPLGALVLATWGGPAAAQTKPALSAGVSEEGRAPHPEYPLKLVFAEERSGAYIGMVAVDITDSAGRTVLSTGPSGPWLFVDLPPGKYRVKAIRRNGVVREGEVTVGRGWQRELILYWPAQG